MRHDKFRELLLKSMCISVLARSITFFDKPAYSLFRYFDAFICVLTSESRLYCLRRVTDIHQYINDTTNNFNVDENITSALQCQISG